MRYFPILSFNEGILSTFKRVDCFTNCKTKVWLISVLMITKQGLELMIIFKV